jgi:PAS domain S-box-containing protein
VFVGMMVITEALVGAKRRSDLARLVIAEEFRSLAETSPDAILFTDSAGLVLFGNPALASMFRLTSKELLGRPAALLVPALEQPNSSGEFLAIRADGSRFYVEATTGRFGAKATIFVRDISDRKAAQEKLRKSEEQLRITQAKLANAAQNAAISELAAAVVHEISQPLSAMVANGQASLRWLTAVPPNMPDGILSVERIVRDGKDAGEVVRGLRFLFRRSTPEKTSLDLGTVAEEVAALLRDRAQLEDIVVDLEHSSTLPAVEGDKIQLQQVLVNLIGNAMDALQASPRPRRILIRLRQQESTLVTEILDNGSTTPDFTTIFDPFVTSEEKGMGMGLAICRSIVNAHDGRLWGAALPEGGNVFSFALPLAPGADHGS